MDPILSVAAKFSLKAIEHATEGLGAMYKGRQLGTLRHIGCVSFDGNKIVTTGGGYSQRNREPCSIVRSLIFARSVKVVVSSARSRDVCNIGIRSARTVAGLHRIADRLQSRPAAFAL